MKRSAAAALACLLAAQPARAADCALEQVARLRLRDDGGFLSVRARFAGRPVRLLLDTGSNAGLITPEAVRALGLDRQANLLVRLQGTGGRPRTVTVARAMDLALGDLRLGDVLMPVAELPAAPRLTPRVAGFLGGDVLSRFDLDIDVPHARLGLWRVFGTEADCAPAWRGAWRTVPLQPDGDRLSLMVTLDGQSISALLDTGARSRIVATSTARRIGVDPERLAADPGGISSGVDQRRQFYHWHRFASFAVGGVVEPNLVLTVAPLDSQFDMLLGTDWLASREVWVSYASSKLFIR